MLPFLALRVLWCPHVCVRINYAFFAEIGRFLVALACCVRDSRPALYHPLSFCLDANGIALRWFARASFLVYECNRNQGFFVGTPEPKRWHMDVPFTCTSSLFGHALAHAEKSPLYHGTVGTCFSLFYSIPT